MNAKRLTALALAALMAASTTSVALASEKVEYDLDFEQGVYYRYDEDEGRIVKADPDQVPQQEELRCLCRVEAGR